MDERYVNYYYKKLNILYKKQYDKNITNFGTITNLIDTLNVLELSELLSSDRLVNINLLKIKSIENQEYGLAAIYRQVERCGMDFFKIFERNLIVEKK